MLFPTMEELVKHWDERRWNNTTNMWNIMTERGLAEFPILQTSTNGPNPVIYETRTSY